MIILIFIQSTLEELSTLTYKQLDHINLFNLQHIFIVFCKEIDQNCTNLSYLLQNSSEKQAKYYKYVYYKNDFFTDRYEIQRNQIVYLPAGKKQSQTYFKFHDLYEQTILKRWIQVLMNLNKGYVLVKLTDLQIFKQHCPSQNDRFCAIAYFPAQESQDYYINHDLEQFKDAANDQRYKTKLSLFYFEGNQHPQALKLFKLKSKLPQLILIDPLNMKYQLMKKKFMQRNIQHFFQKKKHFKPLKYFPFKQRTLTNQQEQAKPNQQQM